MEATIANSFETLPDEMKQLKRWLLWKGETKYDNEGNPQRDSQGNIKVDKVPKQSNGYNASKTNPSHYMTFETAMKAYETDDFSGIGFVLVKYDPYVIIDIDDCFTDNGKLNEKAAKIVDTVGSYTEVSQSGNGLHIIVKGNNIDGFNNQLEGIEAYSQKWFFAVTGDVLRDDLTDIEENNMLVNYICDTYRPQKNEEQSEPVEDQPADLTDDHLIFKIKKSKQGDKFSALFDEGDTSKRESNSEADYALANILAWWTKNSTQIERIMRQSALYRDKWDEHPDYLKGRTIQNAIKNNEGVGYGVNDFQLYVNDIQSSELKTILQQRHLKELEYIQEEWRKEDKQGRKPTSISTSRCAVVLLEYINFVLFDLEENTKVAMYMPWEGIYTRNTTIIKRVISWLEPKLNNQKAEEVIYHLTNMAEVRKKTNSRYFIPVENGVFNLETKTLEPFSPDYIFTSKISTRYVQNPTCPVIDGWDIDTWLDSIACGDKEIVHLLWQVINDALNGNYSRKKAIFLVGSGNNGKGTFQELIANLIGWKNVATLKVNEFDEDFKLSELEGKTVVIGDDVPANVYIDDSSNFNSVVTGDRVLVNVKNKPMYNTSFQCGVIQSTNDMPKFRNKTGGTIRRLVIVPFKADFNGGVENTKIKEDFIKNEEVLQYVLHQAINMDFEKFITPEASEKEMEVFKLDNDPVYDFKLSVFDNWTIEKVPKFIAYGFYKMFCEENGYKPLSDRQFYKQFDSYLGDEWKTNAQRKFNVDLLVEFFGQSNLLQTGEPTEGKNYKSYVRNDNHS